MDVNYTPLSFGVTGGEIAGGRWGESDQIAIASHGITANHLSWQRIGELVVERSDGAISLVAVDHRGRAGSADTPGPFGLRAHADDLVAMLDHLGVDRAVFAGHSLGGFIVSAAAEHHPARVERLVLVDGGLPFPGELPAGADVEAVIRAVIGPALDRLDQRWPDEDSYVDFFRAHPAFQPPNEWTPAAEAYVRYDAVPTPEGEIRSSVNKEAVLVDGGAAIADPESASAIGRVTTSATLLWAPRGVLDGVPGLYSAESIEDATDRLAHVDAKHVDDVNHYTIVTSEQGARAVAEAIIA